MESEYVVIYQNQIKLRTTMYNHQQITLKLKSECNTAILRGFLNNYNNDAQKAIESLPIDYSLTETVLTIKDAVKYTQNINIVIIFMQEVTLPDEVSKSLLHHKETRLLIMTMIKNIGNKELSMKRMTNEYDLCFKYVRKMIRLLISIRLPRWMYVSLRRDIRPLMGSPLTIRNNYRDQVYELGRAIGRQSTSLFDYLDDNPSGKAKRHRVLRMYNQALEYIWALTSEIDRLS